MLPFVEVAAKGYAPVSRSWSSVICAYLCPGSLRAFTISVLVLGAFLYILTVQARRIVNMMLVTLAPPRKAVLSDALLVLGGDRAREAAALTLLKDGHLLLSPSAMVIISSGALSHEDITALGLSTDHVIFDRRAVDTVTNFVTTGPLFREHRVRQVMVATSDYHARRGIAVARIVLGSFRMRVVPLVIASSEKMRQERGETRGRVIRDCLRAWLWVWAGLDLSSVTVWLHPTRQPRTI
ncbi:unnamed protein product [Vitrella brassicaformis CCMP3155]|uniref:DUF218 domain-containing protein n=2 Tax=Vitrella brassicaformis TaxID=1169539 RepID=A0A0G4GFQ2_VITBC|nr:unnamed protein product [Vitrella brassicaformis CCMP3155]|mmetsp:Transcript_23078/g.57046  ORF Transcript_23078/g.57046 Transcript_23078/m.57046 type:complete len:239 (+) Transcript_23078:169-885(+)|eukprot:CEM28362.1 unnamed protein product [Vitrella brassicaformis CCMP3155]